MLKVKEVGYLKTIIYENPTSIMDLCITAFILENVLMKETATEKWMIGWTIDTTYIFSKTVFILQSS